MRNIEAMWLLDSLCPDHSTISNFRKDNARAIKRVFRATVEIARNFGLIGATLIAGDSTELRAQNGKKNNFNQKKIQRHLDYIDRKLVEHNKVLENADGDTERQDLYRKRQAIVEHPFRTIKSQWGFDHVITKKARARASADVGLMSIISNAYSKY